MTAVADAYPIVAGGIQTRREPLHFHACAVDE
jgi:hypothetical protein